MGVTKKALWEDMRGFEGHVEHGIVQDVNVPGHLFVIGRWSSREAAGEVLARYSESPNARNANELVAEPGRRAVGRRLTR